MIITVSGLSGCGKNSVGELVAAKLALRPVQASFKDEAKRLGVGLMEMQEMAEKDREFDRILDSHVISEAAKGDCVVMTWLGPWMVKGADLRVWLNATENERAARIARRDRMGVQEALEHVRARDTKNRERYMKYYGIDILEHSIFDLEINTARFAPDASAEIIIAAAKQPRAVKR